jgi:pimeloyl-ACP methyl ester carboxylesterase
MPDPRRDTRLVLFGGLGADGQLFDTQRAGLPGVNVETPAWLEPTADAETVESYGRRTAALVRRAEPGERLYVGGVSFGALVALEVARHVAGVGAAFLIGGCRDTRAVAPFFRFACSLAPLMPLPLFGAILRGGGPGALLVLESLTLDQVRLYRAMLHDASPRQVRWAAGALLKYRSAGDPPGVRVRLIHGQRDLIIPRKNVDPDCVIPHGRHLVSLTRPAEVNACLMREMGIGG